MGVSNGELAVDSTWNSSFMDREGDTDTIGKVDLKKTDLVSGAHTLNVQRILNSIASTLGITTSEVYNALITWSQPGVGTGSQSAKDKIEAIVARFLAAGHAHTGSDGDGAKVSGTDIANVNYRGYLLQGTDLIGVTGTSKDVTTELTGKLVSTGSAVLGVVSNAPYNRVKILQATGASAGDVYRDGSGNEVYGRTTWAAGVWTLSFYVDLSGVETAYSFTGASDLRWFYQELFNPLSPTAPVYDPALFVPSESATADVVDATQTQRGLVSTGAQGFGGVKTFYANPKLDAGTSGGLLFLASDKAIAQAVAALFWDAVNSRLGLGTNAPNAGLDLNTDLAGRITDEATAANINAMPSPTLITRFTGATVTNLNGINNGVEGKVLLLINKSTQTVTLKHEAGAASAEDRLLTSDGADVELTAGSVALLLYEHNSQRWHLLSGGGGGGGALFVTGSEGTPQAIVAGTGVAFTGTKPRSLWFIEGSGGHVVVSANPQIAAATTVGQELIVMGADNDATVELNDGTGLKLNGPMVLAAYNSLHLIWTGSVWAEIARK